MRLSKRTINKIQKSIEASFGDVKVYLFGSRTDDSKRGGDIDLAIETNMTKKEFKQHKVEFVTSMLRLGLDLKIDLVKLVSNDALLNSEINNNKIRII